MPTLLEEHDETDSPFNDESAELTEAEAGRVDQAAERVRLTYKGVRVLVRGIPSQRPVDDSQKAAAAALFGAHEGSVSMSTLLWNAKEPAVKDLRSAIAAVHRTFHDRTLTLPTAHHGLRMIKKNCVADFHSKMLKYRQELRDKAQTLASSLPEIVARERERRSKLFRAEDYDFDPVGSVGLKWWFPSVTEDSELAELDAEVYQAELRRVREEMRIVVLRTEEQMAEELYTMLDTVVERLTGENQKGNRKTFRDATVVRLFDEIDHIASQLKDNGIGGEALVKAAGRVSATLRGQTADTLPGALRTNEGYREHVRDKFAKIADTLLNTAVPVRRRQVLMDRSRVATED